MKESACASWVGRLETIPMKPFYLAATAKSWGATCHGSPYRDLADLANEAAPSRFVGKDTNRGAKRRVLNKRARAAARAQLRKES